MRTAPLIFVILVWFNAQHASLNAAMDFSSMPIEKVREMIKVALPGDSSDEVVNASLESRRFDVILACYDSVPVSSLLSQKVLFMEDCYLKGQLLVMELLHGKSWDDGHPLRANNRQIAQAQLFLPMVRLYLADTPIDYAVISSPERRKALAEKLEAAVKKKWSIIEGDPESEQKQGGLILVPTEPRGSETNSKPTAAALPAISPLPKQASAAKQPTKEHNSDEEEESSGFVLPALVVGAVIIGAVCLLYKRAGRHQD